MKRIIPFYEMSCSPNSKMEIWRDGKETTIILSRKPVRMFYTCFPHDVWIREVTFTNDETNGYSVDAENWNAVHIPKEMIKAGQGYYVAYYFIEADVEEIEAELGKEVKKYIDTERKSDLSQTTTVATTEANKDEKDRVNHPSHYQSENGIEVIDVIDAFTKGLDGVVAFDIGNALKYVCRWKQKGGVEDLKKAIWYLKHAIDRSEG